LCTDDEQLLDQSDTIARFYIVKCTQLYLHIKIDEYLDDHAYILTNKIYEMVTKFDFLLKLSVITYRYIVLWFENKTQ
jgi:hypothetical protein